MEAPARLHFLLSVPSNENREEENGPRRPRVLFVSLFALRGFLKSTLEVKCAFADRLGAFAKSQRGLTRRKQHFDFEAKDWNVVFLCRVKAFAAQ